MLSLASEHYADHALAPEAGAHPCVACSDEPSDYMKSQKISCATYVRRVAQARDKCSKHWAYEGLCQRSCYEAGWGSGACCAEGIARELHQQASASPRRQRAFVVCGQSNALGYGRRSELGPSVKARIAAVADRVTVKSVGPKASCTTSDLSPCGPQDQWSAQCFGPELFLALLVAEADPPAEVSSAPALSVAYGSDPRLWLRPARCRS